MKKDIPCFNLSGQDTFSRLDSINFRDPKTPEEVRSDTRIKQWDAWNNYITSALLLLSGIAFIVISVSFCISIINNPSSAVDDKKWAMSYITLVGGVIVGYLTGKSKS